MQNAQPRSARPSALIVCDDDDTLIRLREYLNKSGVQASATRRLTDTRRGSRTSVVLLPDDFDAEQVKECISRLLSSQPRPFLIVISALPRLFEPLLESFGNPESVVLLPKPIWCWTILELLRNDARNKA